MLYHVYCYLAYLLNLSILGGPPCMYDKLFPGNWFHLESSMWNYNTMEETIGNKGSSCSQGAAHAHGWSWIIHSKTASKVRQLLEHPLAMFNDVCWQRFQWMNKQLWLKSRWTHRAPMPNLGSHFVAWKLIVFSWLVVLKGGSSTCFILILHITSTWSTSC